MTIPRGSIAAAALAITGCGAMSANGPEPERVFGPPDLAGGSRACDAAAAEGLIGERATPETARRLLKATGANALRWAPPRSALTMDYRPDRLTVEYDDDMVITRFTCG